MRRILFIAALACGSAFAAENVLTARAADYQANSRIGRIEFRAELNGTVDLTVAAGSLTAEVYTGSTMRGAAATYTQELPREPLAGFRAVAIGAAKVRVMEEPSPGNGYKARIRVSSKEAKLANVRILWEADRRFAGVRLPVTPAESDNALTGHMELVGRFANDVELHVHGAEVLADGPFVLQRLSFSQPLPTRGLTKFGKRGKVDIVSRPDVNNSYLAVIRVRNVKPEGEDRTIELTWSR